MKLKLIVALVSDEKTEIVMDAARAGGATGATVITSVRGEGLEPEKTFFGLELAARRDDDDEFGLILVSDIARRVIAENRAPERVNVYEVMSKPVLTLASEMQIRYAVRLLARFAVSRAVVVDCDRNPVGIATLRELVLGHAQE